MFTHCTCDDIRVKAISQSERDTCLSGSTRPEPATIVFGLSADIDACNLEASLACPPRPSARQTAFIDVKRWAVAELVRLDVKHEVLSSFFHAGVLSSAMVLLYRLLQTESTAWLGFVAKVTPHWDGSTTKDGAMWMLRNGEPIALEGVDVFTLVARMNAVKQACVPSVRRLDLEL